MGMMTCWCALAGTKACENCSRREEYIHNNDTPIPLTSIPIISIPYTPPISMEERRLQEIENAIKRLNERIDELEELTKWMKGGYSAVANSVLTSKEK